MAQESDMFAPGWPGIPALGVERQERPRDGRQSRQSCLVRAESRDSQRDLLPARTDAWTASGLIMLAHHPGPDVRGTIAKDNTTAGFVLVQEVNGVTVRED